MSSQELDHIEYIEELLNKAEQRLATLEKLLCDVYLDLQAHDVEDAKRRIILAGIVPH